MKKLAEFQRRIGVIDDGQWGPITARVIANRLHFGETALLRVPLSKNFQLRELLVSEIAASQDISNLPDAEQLLALVRLCNNVLEPVRQHYGAQASDCHLWPALRRTQSRDRRQLY